MCMHTPRAALSLAFALSYADLIAVSVTENRRLFSLLFKIGIPCKIDSVSGIHLKEDAL